MAVQLAEFRRSPSEGAVRASKQAEVELFLAALADRTQPSAATRERVWKAVDAVCEAAGRD